MSFKIGFDNFSNIVGAYVTTSSADDAGFEGANILSPRLDKAWRAPVGAATRSIRLWLAAPPTNYSIRYVGVISPHGAPILGDCTVTVLNALSDPTYATVTIPATPAPMPDRRWLYFPTNITANSISVTVPAGSQVARIVCGYLDDAPAVRGWGIETAARVIEQAGAGRGVFSDTARMVGASRRKVPKRRTIQLDLDNCYTSPFWWIDSATGSREMVVMPRPAIYTAGATALAEMQATTIYGSIPRSVPLRYSALSNEWTCSMRVAERI